MNGLGLAAAVAIAGVTYDEIHNLGHGLPCPARYVYVVALFAGIGVLFGRYPPLAAAIAWALVLAMYLGKDSPIVQGVTRRPATDGGPAGGKPKPKGPHKTRGGKTT